MVTLRKMFHIKPALKPDEYNPIAGKIPESNCLFLSEKTEKAGEMKLEEAQSVMVLFRGIP